MKRDVVVVRAEDTLERAARIMRERLIGFLPVCGPKLHAVGVVTDRDLVVRGLAEGREATSPVSAVMTTELVACAAEDDLELAVALMSGRQKSRVLVCDADLHVLGVISLSDLAQHEAATQAAATLRRVTWRDRDVIRSGAVERCADIMKREVVLVGPEDPVVQAARLMRDHGVGFLPVCREDGKLVGVVTDRDLALRALADGGAPDRPVRDVMTRELVACDPQDELARAEELMGRHMKSRLPVVDRDGRVEGVLSLSDVAKHEDPRTVGTTLRQVSAREAC
jgi:CBS domain-containing protein